MHRVTDFGAWGQLLLHEIHLRVLQHIKRISEHPGVVAVAGPGLLPAWMSTSHATFNCTRPGTR